MTHKHRVACFIDGFNLYHAIDSLPQPNDYLKWLDLSLLAAAFIKPSTEVMAGVHYFSAYATWLPEAARRHGNYVAALETQGVHVVLGNFKRKPKRCNACHATWTAHEEKESDVNIALALVMGAVRNEYDTALLMTADTDLVPAIRQVRRAFPEKRIIAVIPQNRFGQANELRQACHDARRIKTDHLQRSLLPEQLIRPDGQILLRPEKYKP